MTHVLELRINSYQLAGGTAYSEPVDVVLQRRPQIDGPDLWSIDEKGCCLNKRGEWEWEPQPSSRTKAFMRRCRFASVEEALAVWDKSGRQSRFTVQAALQAMTSRAEP